MAQGAITAQLTDMSIDRNALRVTGTFSRRMEDSDASVNTIESVSVSITYTAGVLVNKTVAQLKVDLETLAKATYAKLPAVMS